MLRVFLSFLYGAWTPQTRIPFQWIEVHDPHINYRQWRQPYRIFCHMRKICDSIQNLLDRLQEDEGKCRRCRLVYQTN
jgi:hypothetical protein